MIRLVVCSLVVALLAGCSEDLQHPGGAVHLRQQIRPTVGTGWNNNGYGAVTVVNWDTPGGAFRIHYTQEGKHAVPSEDLDGSGVPDFVETFGDLFDLVIATEVGKMGFNPPLDDEKYHDHPDYGGDGRIDVYLQDVLMADGYIVIEACKPETSFQCAGYIVAESTFSGSGYPSVEDGMKVVASHELFHLIQHAYRSKLSLNFEEATAVWATEQVFPQQNDFEQFLPHFFENTDRSLGHVLPAHSDPFPYSLAIWPTFLVERYGAEVLPAIFEELSDTGSSTTDLSAIQAVLARDHQSSLVEAFSSFVLWNYFTGSRAKGFSGYEAAQTFPQLSPREIQAAPPFRISGKIQYLSALYYEFPSTAGQRIRVSSERAEPRLALHLVTTNHGEVQIASSLPDEPVVELAAGERVVMIAASTAPEHLHLPFSLNVIPIPAPGGDTGPVPPTSAEDPGGCGIAPVQLPDELSSATPPILILIMIIALSALRAGGAGNRNDNDTEGCVRPATQRHRS
jgi:hypothetical protein